MFHVRDNGKLNYILILCQYNSLEIIRSAPSPQGQNPKVNSMNRSIHRPTAFVQRQDNVYGDTQPEIIITRQWKYDSSFIRIWRMHISLIRALVLGLLARRRRGSRSLIVSSNDMHESRSSGSLSRHTSSPRASRITMQTRIRNTRTFAKVTLPCLPRSEHSRQLCVTIGRSFFFCCRSSPRPPQSAWSVCAVTTSPGLALTCAVTWGRVYSSRTCCIADPRPSPVGYTLVSIYLFIGSSDPLRRALRWTCNIYFGLF